MLRYRYIGLFLALSLILSGWSAPAQAESPQATLKRLQNRLNGLMRKKTKAGTAQDKRVRAQISTAINSMLDFEELSRRALRSHWDKRTPAERAEFVKLLQELIERNYTNQLRGNLDYKVEYRKSQASGAKAKVLTVVKVEKNRRLTEVYIEYKMRKVNGRWMVYDVVTDEVSIVRNYRSQFNRIIRKKSYQALVDKMRKKLKQMS